MKLVTMVLVANTLLAALSLVPFPLTADNFSRTRH